MKLNTLAPLCLITAVHAFASTTAITKATTKSNTVTKNIAVIQIIAHSSLDQSREGAIKVVQEALGDNAKINYTNVNGNMVLAAQICKSTLAQKPDAVLAIGTPIAQMLVQKNDSVPIIYTPITDPKQAGLLNLGTGSSDYVAPKKVIDLMLQIKPSTKKIGFVYNPGENNSASLLPKVKEAVTNHKRELVLLPVSSARDIVTQIKTHTDLDYLYLPNDNMVANTYELTTELATRNKIPTFVTCEDGLRKGATLAIGPNYNELGEEAGKRLLKVLQTNTKAKDLAVYTAQKTKLLINKLSVRRINMQIPQDIIQQAEVI